MLQGKKLYPILMLLLVFALIGEQPKLRQDMQRASDRVKTMLQVDEVISGWNSLLNGAGNIYQSLSERLLAHASANAPAKALQKQAPIERPETKIVLCPLGNKGKC